MQVGGLVTITTINNTIEEQLGYDFRFVLYQMSKNLSRPFFMDFLTCLSVRFSEKGEEIDTDSDNGIVLTASSYSDNYLIIAGDNLMTMLLKPSYTAQDSQMSEDKVPAPTTEIKSLIRAASGKR